ncbi:T9SS sorting signal type C domain-containing protein [Xanthomarina sp. F2636L]|uniref:T9SS sorting signal type C domain-containing protein n=1 Tax=Xanthomarina sp. F2636L TaxID=2996018 RepID=UPI00225E58FC|nr:T9SS sorting signal type C domain-containing protein [Xanthomarina sp. F2636L]MCX7550969.1 T9SS sorting signal type C domain-containing protein [Xanthomarina sp. F2636L]
MNLKTTILLFFILSACFIAKAQIINNGVLKIASSTNVSFQDEYTNASTGNHVSDGEFYLNNNFINHGITSASEGTTYFKSATNNLLTLSGDSENANFYNLEIDVTAIDKKGVSVVNNFSLQVANALNFKSGDLRLIANAQLVQEHSGVNNNTIVSGKLIIDQQGTISPYQYDYWSSPVNNGGTFSFMGGKFDGTDSSLNPFNPTQILFNSGSPYNGLPSVLDGGGNVTTALTTNTRWLYKYSRGSGSYSQWIALNSSSAINPGEGYTMKGPNSSLINQNYVFYGAPNNGDYQFPISTAEMILLGNPYPSAIDIKEFITDNSSILETLYFWVDGGSTSHVLSDYLGGYAARNMTGGITPSIASSLISGIGTSGSVTEPSQYLPIGKGFFVEAIGSGNIIFKNSQRIFKAESARYSSEDANKYVRIGYEDPEGFHTQMLLGFLPDSPADLSYNPGYDALQMSSREDDVFFIIENNVDKRYVIQGVNDFYDAMEFPIGLLITEQGTHRIMLDSVENFNETVYLKDNLLNITYNLSDAEHEINLPSGEYLDRFSIVFQPAETLNVETSPLDRATVFYNGQNNIVVANITNLEINSIDVYNILGQHIISVTENLKNQNKIKIPFTESNGVYLVVLNTNTSKKSTKILKY